MHARSGLISNLYRQSRDGWCSLSQIIRRHTEAEFFVLELTEGKPAASLAQMAPESFGKLSTEPCFLFLKCDVE